jgi:hypothetical protein
MVLINALGASYQQKNTAFLRKQGKATLAFIHSAHSLHPHHHSH